MHYIKQILVWKTLKQKFIMAYQKQKLKKKIFELYKIFQTRKAQK